MSRGGALTAEARGCLPGPAFAEVQTFIELNGGQLEATDLELFPQYLALAEGKLAERDFAAWLRDRTPLSPRSEAHERRRPYRAARRTASARR